MSVMHAIDIIAGAMFDAGIGLDLRMAVISPSRDAYHGVYVHLV